MKCFESLGERCDVDVCVLQFTSCAQRPSSVPRKGRPAGFAMGHRLPNGHPAWRVGRLTRFWPTSGIPEDGVSRRKLCSLSLPPSAILVTCVRDEGTLGQRSLPMCSY